jgi:phosphatidate phosphatase APP1
VIRGASDSRRRRAAAVACAIACAVASGLAHGRPKEAWLEIYTAYATPAGGTILGRAHEGRPPVLTARGPFRSIRELHRSFDVEVIPGVSVSVRFAAEERVVTTDSHGYFEVRVAPGMPAPGLRVHVALVDRRWTAEPLDAQLPVFRDEHGLALLSDVDDTLVDTHARNKLALLGHILTHPGSQLLAFDGAAATLTALAGTGADARPVVYISGSPTRFRRRLGDWLERSGFPPGPMVLKRFSSEPIRDQMAYKWPHIVALVDGLPSREWVLFGDSGENDPETYRRLMVERPGRVRKVYIHLVTSEAKDAPRFRGMTTFRQWAEVGEDLRRFGLMAGP